MFRPNRVGTPKLHAILTNTSSASPTGGAQGYTLPGVTGYVINAVPDGEFGYAALSWGGGTFTLPASNTVALLHQFIVPQPIEGDAVGIEVNGGLQIFVDENVTIQPVFCKLAAAGGGTLAAVSSNTTQPVYLADPYNGIQGDTTPGFHGKTYTQQVVHRYPSVQGPFAHGFQLFNPGANPITISAFHMNASVRQLMDQQNIGYRDTLR